jgi:hypothetical protein
MHSWKRRLRSTAAGSLLLGGLFFGTLGRGTAAGPALQDTDTTTIEPPSATVFVRPLIVLEGYSPGGYAVSPGQEFDLSFRLANAGQIKARNIVATFAAGDFIPRGTGGVVAAGVIAPGASTGYSQPMTASPALSGGSVGSLPLTVTYTDDAGTPYSESFTLSIPIANPTSRAPSGPAATRTPTPGPRPQLLIQAYETDFSPLTPGARFTLLLDILNVGGSPARRITMILGGGTSTGGEGGATPGAGSTGGLSGASGDYSHFAPVGSSNVQFLGDLPANEAMDARQTLIVNSSTEPGAYPLRITFVYLDARGNSQTDDQVITLLVYSPPRVEISFYRTPDPLMVGQPGVLPLQIVNLGRNSVILGRMEVAATGAQMSNNSMLVGFLDAGGYLTLDANAIPDQPGTLDLAVTIDYLDDFSQAQTITQSLSVEVIEGEPLPPEGSSGTGASGEAPLSPPETFWQRLWRAIRGFLGLDSGLGEPVVPLEPGTGGTEGGGGGGGGTGPIVVPIGPKG